MLRVTAVAAEAQSQADAGIDGVVGRGSVVQFGRKDLRTVLDGAVEEHAFGVGLGGSRLLYAQGAVEVADLEDGVAGVGGVQHDGEDKQQRAGGGPQQALGPTIAPCDGNGEECRDEERDGKIVVGREDQRAGDADEEGSGRATGGDQEVEERRLRAALRTQSVGFGVAEETGEKAFGEEEENGDADGKADIGLRNRVAEAGQHHDEQTHDDAAAVERGKLEGEDEGKQVDGERKHPEQRDGGDVDGQVCRDGAQLHGGGHGKQKPKPFRSGLCWWQGCSSCDVVRCVVVCGSGESAGRADVQRTA